MQKTTTRKCINCLHCSYNKTDKTLSCAINKEVTPGDCNCRAFAPKDNEVELRHAEEIVGSKLLFGHAAIIFGVLVFTVLLFIGVFMGFEALNISAAWGLVITGTICVSAGAVYLLLRDKTPQKSSVKPTVKPLSVEGLKKKLIEMGYQPEPYGENAYYIESHGNTYIVGYQNGRIHTWGYFGLHEQDLGFANGIILDVKDQIFGVKYFIQDFVTEDGRTEHLLYVTAEFYADFDEDFALLMPRYLFNVEVAIDRAYNQLKQRTNTPQNNSRADMYGPECRWLPGLVKMVSNGQIPSEALTDETWIRETIQSKINDALLKAEWDNFKIKRVDNYGEYKLITYEFPEPKITPEAKYAAVMLNTATLQADYYTLEMSYDDKWYYCSATEEEHFNYGEAESTDLDNFIEWILSKKKSVEAKADWSKSTPTVSTPKNVN